MNRVLIERLTDEQRKALSVLVLAALVRPELLHSAANQRPDSFAQILRQTFNVLK